MPLCAQVVAGLRCKKSKTEFLLRSLMGHRWTREELFTSEASARPEANAILSHMSAMLQHSSSVGARCVHCGIFQHRYICMKRAAC